MQVSCKGENGEGMQTMTKKSGKPNFVPAYIIVLEDAEGETKRYYLKSSDFELTGDYDADYANAHRMLSANYISNKFVFVAMYVAVPCDYEESGYCSGRTICCFDI